MQTLNHCWQWQTGNSSGLVHADSLLQAKQLLSLIHI